MEQSSDKCPVTVLQKVEVTGAVTITPKIKCGPLTVTCLEGRVDRDDSGSCGRKGRTTCRLVLVQEICVEVPVTFSAGAACEVEQVHCGHALVVFDDCGEDGSGSSDQSCRSDDDASHSDPISSGSESGECSDSDSSDDLSSDASGESGSAWDR